MKSNGGSKFSCAAPTANSRARLTKVKAQPQTPTARRRKTTTYHSENPLGSPQFVRNCHSASIMRSRLDLEMTRRGLATSREGAQRLIMAGRVRVNSCPASKADLKVDAETEIAVIG